MRIHSTILVAIVCLLAAGSASADSLQFIAHDPVSNSFFDVFANLIPPDPITPPNPITPPSPIHDLSDPTRLLLTNNVDTRAFFSFGMIGRNGETFSFSQPQIDTPLGDSHHTVSLFNAQGSLGSFFDVVFDASYQDDTGRHAPLSAVPGGTPPDPIFPQGSLSIDYTLQADPPFTVGIFMFHPGVADSDLVTFSAVPEPGSVVLYGCGLAGLIVAHTRGRWRSRVPLRKGAHS